MYRNARLAHGPHPRIMCSEQRAGVRGSLGMHCKCGAKMYRGRFGFILEQHPDVETNAVLASARGAPQCVSNHALPSRGIDAERTHEFHLCHINRRADPRKIFCVDRVER